MPAFIKNYRTLEFSSFGLIPRECWEASLRLTL
jgi:hypothetical protein